LPIHTRKRKKEREKLLVFADCNAIVDWLANYSDQIRRTFSFSYVRNLLTNWVFHPAWQSLGSHRNELFLLVHFSRSFFFFNWPKTEKQKKIAHGKFPSQCFMLSRGWT
jgi:hypothetical protein